MAVCSLSPHVAQTHLSPGFHPVTTHLLLTCLPHFEQLQLKMMLEQLIGMFGGISATMCVAIVWLQHLISLLRLLLKIS